MNEQHMVTLINALANALKKQGITYDDLMQILTEAHEEAKKEIEQMRGERDGTR